MGVLNFTSVMTVLRSDIPYVVWPGQVQFIETLFNDYRKEMSSNASLDSGLISKWITISKIELLDDRRGENGETGFYHHCSFLRSLRKDNLVIIDHFNATAEQDAFLSELLRYRCRILFTTRCRYEDHVSMELSELGQDVLLKLLGNFFPEAR